MAQIKIYRRLGYLKGPLYPVIEIYIDNEFVNQIEIQQTIVLDVTDGEHTIFCKDKSMNTYSNTINFTSNGSGLKSFTINPFNYALPFTFLIVVIGIYFLLGWVLGFETSLNAFSSILTLVILLSIVYYKTIGKRKYFKIDEANIAL